MPDRKFATVVIVGSADYPDAYERVHYRLATLRRDFAAWQWIVVTSDTTAVDRAAQRAAVKLGMILHVIKPDFEAHDDLALAICNEMMLLETTRDVPDRVIAFWDFQREATKDMIRRALLNHLQVEVWDDANEPRGADALEAIFGAKGVPSGQKG